MSQVCDLSGKKPGSGNAISFSERHTRRRFMPNVTTRTIVDPVSGKKIRLKVSTRALRTLAKNPAKFKAAFKKLVKKASK